MLYDLFTTRVEAGGKESAGIFGVWLVHYTTLHYTTTTTILRLTYLMVRRPTREQANMLNLTPSSKTGWKPSGGVNGCSFFALSPSYIRYTRLLVWQVKKMVWKPSSTTRYNKNYNHNFIFPLQKKQGGSCYHNTGNRLLGPTNFHN